MQESFPGYNREVYTLGTSGGSDGMCGTELSSMDSIIDVCSGICTRYAPPPACAAELTSDERAGPLLWAPAGEVSGRRALYIFTFALFTVFNACCIASRNITTLIVLRL